MAAKIGPNLREAALKAAALRLSETTNRSAEDYAEIIVVDGVPSGRYDHPDTAALVAISLQDDAEPAFYVSPAGASTWTFLGNRDHQTARTSGAIGNGTTAGRLRTTATCEYCLPGTMGPRLYSKASTDDLWNLSALTDTTGAQYRAVALCLDASGTATIETGAVASTAALALQALPVIPTTKSVVGVFVAGPSTNWDAGGGLAAQGTIYNGWG